MWSYMSCPHPQLCSRCSDGTVTIVNPYTFLEGAYNTKCLKKGLAAKLWRDDSDEESSSSDSSSSSSSSSDSDCSNAKSERPPARCRSPTLFPIVRSCTF